jgi:antitoxin HicB
MDKQLDYYLNLNYPIEITALSEEENGGYSACIPQLGRNAYVAYGDTIEEAFQNLNLLKRELLESQLKNRSHIPIPVLNNEEEYSGKFILRVPKELHRSLATTATRNNISLNQYTQYLLTYALTSANYEEMISSCGIKITKLLQDMRELEYHFEGMRIKNSNPSVGKHNYGDLSIYAEAA